MPESYAEPHNIFQYAAVNMQHATQLYYDLAHDLSDGTIDLSIMSDYLVYADEYVDIVNYYFGNAMQMRRDMD